MKYKKIVEEDRLNLFKLLLSKSGVKHSTKKKKMIIFSDLIIKKLIINVMISISEYKPKIRNRITFYLDSVG